MWQITLMYFMIEIEISIPATSYFYTLQLLQRLFSETV